jgi:2-keto-3-deoxy-L-rhamnonate aldolase RhmA
MEKAMLRCSRVNPVDKRPLCRRLLDGETVYGLVIKAPAPALAEMCAAAGFDFAFLDGEHGSGEALELENHVRAAESFGIPAVVRVGSHQPAEILRALDVGAEGIVVPHVNTKAEAEAIVQAEISEGRLNTIKRSFKGTTNRQMRSGHLPLIYSVSC